jgi:hypothetical protein
MSNANERLFSYGTLRNADVQLATFGRLLDGAPDAIVGFRQETHEVSDAKFLARGGNRLQLIVVCSGNAADRVPGSAYMLTASELAAADAYEPQDYRRIETVLASGARAWVYARPDD